MDYITFLKKMNELSEHEWKAVTTKNRDYLAITQDGNIAIDYDNEMQNGVFSLFALGGESGKAIDLIYAFAQSKDPFDTNETEEESMKSFGSIQNCENSLEILGTVIADQINSLIEENHAD